MSKVIVVQDGNLVLTAAGTDVIGDNANVASFKDEFITTGSNTTLQFTDSGNGGFYDTITSDDIESFITLGFKPGMTITVAGSASNDGTYTIGEGGVTADIITIIGGFTNEGPTSTGTITLLGIDKAEELTTGSFLNVFSNDGTEEFSINVNDNGWMEVRAQAKDGSGLFVYGGGHIGIFDYTEGTADITQQSVDATDTAYTTIGGWNDGQWSLWEVGTNGVADLDLSFNNYVPDAGLSGWVTDITDTFIRRTFESDYATGMHLYWPTSNVVRLSTLASGSIAIKSDTSADGTRKRIDFQHQSGTQRGYVGINADNAMYLAHQIHGSQLFLTAENNSGAAQVLFTGDPDTETYMKGTTTARIYVGETSSIETALLATFDGAVDLYYDNTVALSTDTAGAYSPLGSVYLEEKTTPGGDTAARGQLWVRDDNPQTLMFTDGDSTDFAVAGGGVPNVLATGTPVNNQVAVWTAANTIEGDANFQWNGSATTTEAFAVDAPTGLTSGYLMDVVSNVSTKTGDVVRIIQNHGTATAGALFIQQNSTNAGATLFDMSHVAASSAAYAGRIRTSGIFNGAVLNLHHDHASSTGAVLTITQDGTGNAITVTGGNNIVTDGGLVLPLDNDAATPTLAFGDADTGFYESADDTLKVSVATNPKFFWVSDQYRAETSGGASMLNEAASATNPTLIPDNANLSTGIGSSSADVLSVITNSIEAKRIVAATVQTPEAAVTEIIGIPVASGEGFGFEIHVMGTQDATGDTVFERIFGAIRNQGGTTALVGSTVTDRTDDAGASTWVIAVAADDTADELTVDVTGEASHTIDWKVRVELLNV